MLENVVRSISYYRKQEDFPRGEYSLVGVELGTLRALFQVPYENPMYEVYPIGPEQAPTFEEAVAKKFDFDKYDYFLDCHTATYEESFRATLRLSDRARRLLNRRRPVSALRAAREALVNCLQARALATPPFPTIESTRAPAWLLRTAGLLDVDRDELEARGVLPTTARACSRRQQAVMTDVYILWNPGDLSTLKKRAHSLVGSVQDVISLEVDRWLCSRKSKSS